MKTLTKEVIALLDSKGNTAAQVKTLTDMVIMQPGAFWPAVNTRTLGKKRLVKLERLAIVAAVSNDPGIHLAGAYVSAVFVSVRTRLAMKAYNSS